jgi:hypothetical protein
MRKGDVDWKQFATELLWRNCIHDKNGYSGYDLVTEPERYSLFSALDNPFPRGDKPGDIVRDTSILSYWIGPVKRLSWKELALALGLFEDHFIPDGHDCKKCKCADTCHAYFKDDPDHEVCGWWKEHYCVPKDGRLFRRHAGGLEESLATTVTVKDLNEIKDILSKCFPEGYLKNIHIEENGYEDVRLRGRWGENSDNYARQYKVLADFDKYKNQCIGYTNFYDE